MSGNNGSNGSSQQSFAPPPTPQPTSEYYNNNGVPTASRVYDPKTKSYTDNTILTPDQAAIQKNATGYINQLTQTIPNIATMDPAALQKGVDAYTAPQYQALDTAYNKALGDSQNSAAAGGMTNSVGFNKYLADSLDRNKAQDSANIAASGEQMRYELPNMALQPYANAFNIVNGALNGQQINQQNQLGTVAAGSQATNGFNLQNYQNQLNAFNSSLQGHLNTATGGASGFASSFLMPGGMGAMGGNMFGL